MQISSNSGSVALLLAGAIYPLIATLWAFSLSYFLKADKPNRLRYVAMPRSALSWPLIVVAVCGEVLSWLSVLSVIFVGFAPWSFDKMANIANAGLLNLGFAWGDSAISDAFWAVFALHAAGIWLRIMRKVGTGCVNSCSNSPWCCRVLWLQFSLFGSSRTPSAVETVVQYFLLDVFYLPCMKRFLEMLNCTLTLDIDATTASTLSEVGWHACRSACLTLC